MPTPKFEGISCVASLGGKLQSGAYSGFEKGGCEPKFAAVANRISNSLKKS